MSNHQEHEFVDLGLPSGTLWATCNIGANKPEDYGDYLTWYEAAEATSNLGEGWYMPYKEQWEELMQNTRSTWMMRNGVNGRLFIANNGNTVFLPVAGYRNGENIDDKGSYGDYWSNSLNNDKAGVAWFFDFNSEYCDICDCYYCEGLQSVRAVRSKK